MNPPPPPPLSGNPSSTSTSLLNSSLTPVILVAADTKIKQKIQGQDVTGYVVHGNFQINCHIYNKEF